MHFPYDTRPGAEDSRCLDCGVPTPQHYGEAITYRCPVCQAKYRAETADQRNKTGEGHYPPPKYTGLWAI